MSCGCGGKRSLPTAVTLRLEAARLTLNSGSQDFAARAAEVYAFVIDGVDVAKLDESEKLPVAVGDSAEAITSRNALLNGSLSHVHGLPREAVAKAMHEKVMSLGTLAQWNYDACARAIGGDSARALDTGLRQYGLALGSDHTLLREWILQGPRA